MEKLESTYLSKMDRPRLHPRFNYLLRTGRTSCDGFNLQNLPRESSLLAGDPEAIVYSRLLRAGQRQGFHRRGLLAKSSL